MQTEFMFECASFSPTGSELDDTHDDYINPGIFALQLADFLAARLEAEGVCMKFRCQEDWGHWMEVDHPNKFTLALGCSNLDSDTTHRFFIEPRKPTVRRFFRKIDVEREVEDLRDRVLQILRGRDDVSDIRVLEQVGCG